MSDNASRRGAVDLGVPLMILAFVVIGWFLYWLNAEAQAERALDVVEDTASESGDMGMAQTIEAAALQTVDSTLEGRMVRVPGVEVASRLGAQGFWVTLPNRNPFLVSMGEEVIAEGTSPNATQRVTVVGTILPMTDSIVNAWIAAGTIGQGDVPVVQFATHFLEARRVDIAGGPQGGSGSTGG